ncbi:MAG: ABC transporter ATP-binding protein [Candidatus Electrothrix aestuarii]|uniref:ABC transporter ATP-binding protein n=1 Tax=Candidatus Electrothrix aestuarii TaxID=3062594 RepID=A0AAU8LXA8_9BACT|nr:ABC transporter ATP-binding protein [Candidatus Electrothrix aestuarii]
MKSKKTKQLPTDGLIASLNRLRFLFNQRDKIIFLFLFLGMITGALLETFSIGIIPAFIGAAIQPEKIMQYAPAKAVLEFLGITDTRSLLLWGCLGLLVVFALKTVFLCVQYYFQIKFVQNRRFRLTHRLFTAYMTAPYQFHIQRNSSELFSNTINEVAQIMSTVLMPVLMLTMQTVIMTAILVMLFAVQPDMTLVAILLLGIAGGGFQWVVKNRLITYSRIAQEHRKRMIQSIQQGLGVIKELQILRREKNFIQALKCSMWKTIKAGRFQALTNRVTTPYMEFVAVFSLLSVTILLLLTGAKPQTVAPTLALFAVSFVKLKANISQIVNAVNQIRFGLVSIDPVYNDLKLLERSNEKVSLATTSALQPLHFSTDIRVENVNYRYPNCEEYALKNIDLCLPKGRCVALVGQTGSGKTTLVDIILGLLEPESGCITADNCNIQANLAAWQTNIGYIPQFIYLTDDSIRRNIALGIDDGRIDENQVGSALRAAQLESFVQTLPQGLDTIVGEGGVKLSGGQRQRIGIARALYHNPDILIMDEATSALDNATEKAVVGAINQLRGDKTIIMIAHRLSTIQNSDTLYFMKNGRIEMSGTYEELIKDHNGFRKMAQAG